MGYSFDDITESEDFNFDNILIDEKSKENILIYDILYKTLIVQNLCVLDSIKQMDLLKFMIELDT